MNSHEPVCERFTCPVSVLQLSCDTVDDMGSGACGCGRVAPRGTAAKKRGQGKLKIESTVDGAKVELNGLKAGKTPLKPMRLKADPTV